MNFHKLKYVVSKEKIKFTRGYTYVSTLGIPFLVSKQLEVMFPSWNWVWFFIIAVVGIWIIGEIDFKKGFYANEAEFGLIYNPEFQKLKEKVK